jgi:hypothetical protein
MDLNKNECAFLLTTMNEFARGQKNVMQAVIDMAPLANKLSEHVRKLEESEKNVATPPE